MADLSLRWWRPVTETETEYRKLSNTYVNTSADGSNTSSDSDRNPKGSTATFTHFLMKENRRSAAILQLSKLHPEGAIIFHDTPAEEKSKRDRRALIERVKKNSK